MDIEIKSPNMINKKWTWIVRDNSGVVARGRAKTEPESWRLANDAVKHLLQIQPRIIPRMEVL